MLQCLNTDGFFVVYVDNIDFLHTQARIRKGKKLAWHINTSGPTTAIMF